MGNFVEVDFDCKIDYNLSQIGLDRIVMRSVKDAMSSLKGQRNRLFQKSYYKRDKNQTVFYVWVEYLFEDQKQSSNKRHHYFE